MLLLFLACTDPTLGVDYSGETLTVVDLHLHNGDWDHIPDNTQSTIAGNFPFPFSLAPAQTAASVLSTEGVVEQLDDAGIHHGVLLAVYAPRTVGVATNEQILERVQAAPDRLWGMASLSIEDWGDTGEDALADLAEALTAPEMIGVKLAHTHMHQRMDDPRYYDIYAVAAAAKAPLYIHTGPSPFPGTRVEPAYTDPRYLEEAIATYPDAEFVLGHACYDFLEENLDNLDACLDLMARYDNVWLEISALGSDTRDDYGSLIQRLRDDGLTQRTLYGSDGPQRPGFVGSYLQTTLTAMQDAGYSADEAQAVLAGNFAQLYDVTVADAP